MDAGGRVTTTTTRSSYDTDAWKGAVFECFIVDTDHLQLQFFILINGRHVQRAIDTTS